MTIDKIHKDLFGHNTIIVDDKLIISGGLVYVHKIIKRNY